MPAKVAKRKTPSPSKRVAPRRPAPSMRPCLSNFGKPHAFASGGPSERICPKCRRKFDESFRGVGLNLLYPHPTNGLEV